MSRWFWLFIFLFINQYGVAKEDRWSQHYRLVQKDIQKIRSIRNKDASLLLRLFELYGEKFALLTQKENEFRLSFLEDKVPKNKLDKINRIQKTTLKNIDYLANALKRSTRDKQVQAKISYYRALSYQLDKNYKTYFKEMLRASKLNRDPKLGQLINTKLADYYYNNKKYSNAVKYYIKVINDKNDRWLTKHFYNLGWSLFKLGKTDEGLKMLRQTVKLSRDKKYFDLGEQLIDSVLLFYANAHKIEEGIDYIESQRLSNFDRLLKFLHYAFEYSDKKKAPIILDHIKSKKLSLEQQYEFLDKVILVYRTLKFRKKLQNELTRFANDTKTAKHDNDSEKRVELVSSLMSYTGYLQELLKSKNMISEAVKSTYSNYIVVNFNLLRQIDPSNSLQYRYFQGETFFNLEKHKIAIDYYIRGIREYKNTNKSEKESLAKIYDALFKSFEILNIASGKKLIYVYRSYLKHYPKTTLANDIHSKLIAYYIKRKEASKGLSQLIRYNKMFPHERKKQVSLYNALVAVLFTQKDFDSILGVRKLLEKGFLGLGAIEIRKIDKDYATLTFSRFEQFEKEGKFEEALAGFESLALDPKQTYLIRSSGIRKAMLLSDRLQSDIRLASYIFESLKILNKKDFKKFKDEIKFVLTNICLRNNKKECVRVAREFKSNGGDISGVIDTVVFRNRIYLGEKFESLLQVANTKEKKQLLFQGLLTQSSSFSRKELVAFYKDREFKNIIINSIETAFWQSYFRTLNIKTLKSFANSIAIVELKNVYLKIVGEMQSLEKKVSISTPTEPNWEEVTFEAFAAYNEQLVGKLLEQIQNFDSMIVSSNTNYAPRLISLIIREMSNLKSKIEGHDPKAEDQELVKAIKGELSNIEGIVGKKIEEYKVLYHKSMAATLKNSGSRRYQNTLMLIPLGPVENEGALWLK